MARQRLICNDQGPLRQNTELAGAEPYATADYGAAWATTASITASLAALFPAPQNGDECVLWNSNGAGSGRWYCYAGGAWRYSAVT
jgi:hypothetical protein